MKQHDLVYLHGPYDQFAKKDGSFEKCRTYARKHKLPVHFTGKLEKNEWHQLSEECDVFINTSTIDNTPVSIIERRTIKQAVFSIQGSVTASFGVVEVHSQESAKSVMKRADNALYLAKEKGRDRVSTGGLLTSAKQA